LKVDVIGNDVEKALKILKRNLSRDGLFREMRNRKFYEKPSVKKKRKQAAARKNKRKMGF
jgi:small subunit ribosomal protein S21